MRNIAFQIYFFPDRVRVRIGETMAFGMVNTLFKNLFEIIHPY